MTRYRLTPRLSRDLRPHMAANARATIVELPRLTRQAAIMPKTFNVEARTVDVVWTTGSRVLRGFFDQYWEELSLDPKDVDLSRLNDGAPVLNAHDGSDANGVIGVVVSGSAAVDGKRGTATIRFARAEDDPCADMIFRKIQDGIIQNLSVGYATLRMEKISDGGADKIPIYRATKWQPMELSPVPVGADNGAGFRSGTAPRLKCEFINTRQQQEQHHMADDNNETDTETADPATGASGARSESAAAAATRAATQARLAAAKEIAEARKAAAEDARINEQARAAGIDEVAEQAGLGARWASDVKAAGCTVTEARDAAFRSLVGKDGGLGPVDTHLRVDGGDDERDKYIRGAVAWLIERTGKRKLLEDAKKADPELFGGVEFGSSGGSFRGLSPAEIARDTLERQGVKTRGMPRMEMLGKAFTFQRAGALQTTSDFALILENTLHKLLLGSYATQETTWQRFCGTEDVPDFRPSNRYRTGSLPSLPKVIEHAEYKNGVIPDAAKYQISTERHGEIFALSREVIINDDMGALANLAAEFGRAAARTIENDVYALLAQNSGLGPTMADTKPFFDAAHGNVGTGSAIGAAGLDGDRVLMRAQKDPGGLDFLSLPPNALLVADTLYFRARQINISANDPDAASLSKIIPNPVQGLFQDVIGTPRLTGTRRYIFAAPSVAAGFVVAFLEGYGRGPIMESQAGWRVDGVEWKITQYAKAQPADTKAAVTNAGA